MLASVCHREILLLYAPEKRSSILNVLMHTFRVFSVWLLRVLCVMAVSGTIYLVTISTTLLDRHDVKEWVGASGVYKDGALISAMFAQPPDAQASTNAVVTEQDVITTDAIKQALVRTFPTPLLKQYFNGVIDESYNWMEGKSTHFSFLVPIDAKRQTFINELIKEVEPTVAALPLCSPYTHTLCRPANVAPADFTRQLVTDSFATSDFMQTPITEKTFSSATSASERSSLSQLPVLRRAVTLLLWILPVLFIVTAFGVWLLAMPGTRLSLFNKISRTVFSSMALAVLLSGAIIIFDKLRGLPIEAALPKAGALAPIMAKFVTELILAFAWALLVIAAIPLVISLISWITFAQLKKHRTTQAEPPTENPPQPPLPPLPQSHTGSVGN